MSQIDVFPSDRPLSEPVAPVAGSRDTDRVRDTDRRNLTLQVDAALSRIGAQTGPDRLPAFLARVARSLSSRPEIWQPLLRFDSENRWYERLSVGDGWEAWLLTWQPGQGTDLHDHGGSSGAFSVLSGELTELTPAPTAADRTRTESRRLAAGRLRAFGPRHIHQVSNAGRGPAASLHVYGPALTVMNRYEIDPERGPVVAVTERAGQDW